MVCNPKTDSNLEFGCPNTAKERKRSAREMSNGQRPLEGPPVRLTGQHPSLPCEAHVPHMGMVMWPPLIGH